MSRDSSGAADKITAESLRQRKHSGRRIVALTAYDYPTACILDQAGIDLVLVGDSVANTVLGHENTLSVTLDEVIHHACAVRRGVQRALVVGDLPFGSYNTGVKAALKSAVRLVKEAGVEAVKLEGGAKYAKLAHRIVEAEIDRKSVV